MLSGWHAFFVLSIFLLQTDYEEDDEIIFCDGCNVGVHQSCYGLDSVPHDDWLCHACTLLGYKVCGFDRVFLSSFMVANYHMFSFSMR